MYLESRYNCFTTAVQNNGTLYHNGSTRDSRNIRNTDEFNDILNHFNDFLLRAESSIELIFNALNFSSTKHFLCIVIFLLLR